MSSNKISCSSSKWIWSINIWLEWDVDAKSEGLWDECDGPASCTDGAEFVKVPDWDGCCTTTSWLSRHQQDNGWGLLIPMIGKFSSLVGATCFWPHVQLKRPTNLESVWSSGWLSKWLLSWPRISAFIPSSGRLRASAISCKLDFDFDDWMVLLLSGWPVELRYWIQSMRTHSCSGERSCWFWWPSLGLFDLPRKWLWSVWAGTGIEWHSLRPRATSVYCYGSTLVKVEIHELRPKYLAEVMMDWFTTLVESIIPL